jgi:hypothetical protein
MCPSPILVHSPGPFLLLSSCPDHCLLQGIILFAQSEEGNLGRGIWHGWPKEPRLLGRLPWGKSQGRVVGRVLRT